MARGRSRVGSYGRGQTTQGIEASKSFGRGFAGLAGGAADIATGAMQSVKQATSAMQHMFNKPTVAPVRSSTPGTMSAKPTAASASTTASTAAAPTPGPAKAPAAGTAKPAPAPKSAAAPLAGKGLQSRISDLAKSNKIADPNKIYAGKSMNVDGQKYTIQKGDTLTGIAKKFSGSSTTAKSAAPAPSVPAKLGGSDQSVTRRITTTNNKSVMEPGSADKIGKLNKTPMQSHDSVPSTDRAAATRQMFDMNRPSPGSTADLAKRVNPPSEPTTSMPTPSKVKAQFGDVGKQTPPAPIKDVKMRPMQESVQVGENKYRIV